MLESKTSATALTHNSVVAQVLKMKRTLGSFYPGPFH